MPEWKGPEDLRAHLVPLRSLSADPKNARRHPERNLNAIRDSVRRFGQRKPVVVRSGVVVAGSGTLQAMDMEGYEEIAVVSADDLTEEEARAYGVADNQTGDLAEWDIEPLRAVIESLPQELRDVSGFDESDMKAIQNLTFEKKEKAKAEEQGFKTLKLTDEQAEVLERATLKMRQEEADSGISPGRVIELLCADYLS